MKNITIGADPEVFVRARNGRPVSGVGLVPGTKEAPAPLEGADGASVQVDGLALEFNLPPCSTAEEFVAAIDKAMTSLQKLLPPHLCLLIKAAVDFSPTHMKKQPFRSLELGCSPDFSAYTGRPNLPPQAPPTMRTAAGHVHIGWTKDAEINREHAMRGGRVCRALDSSLGLLLTVLDRDPASQRRRNLYGRAGDFRPKPYGCEYRVPANTWLATPELQTAVFDISRDVAERALEARDDAGMGIRPQAAAAINAGQWSSYDIRHLKQLLSGIADGKYASWV